MISQQDCVKRIPLRIPASVENSSGGTSFVAFPSGGSHSGGPCPCKAHQGQLTLRISQLDELYPRPVHVKIVSVFCTNMLHVERVMFVISYNNALNRSMSMFQGPQVYLCRKPLVTVLCFFTSHTWCSTKCALN